MYYKTRNYETGKKLDEKAILSRLSNGALSNILGGVGLNDKFQQPIDECLAGCGCLSQNACDTCQA